MEHAPSLSPNTRLIKLADKTANVADLSPTTPASWPLQQKLDYLDWAERVIAGIRGTNAALEERFAQTLAKKRPLLSS